jgi:hypothetical protein
MASEQEEFFPSTGIGGNGCSIQDKIACKTSLGCTNTYAHSIP